ncbi:MAG TPA: MaoC family dehydratase N-terminal domain-containing protein [Acetobacteraceae bacterium]|nr:MaoC family dehydratase N-terminal domain-containing protein [Acetobacteraceae bacterium]
MSYDSYIGKTETSTDMVSPRLVEGLAATLGLPVPATLPPLWHWMLFQNWVAPGELGPDGHPRRGGFLPPVHDLPRRMWAGGRVRLLAPLRPGDRVTRTSTILAVAEKQGGSGRLVFVTVRHAIAGPAGPAIDEEQDIVYRGTEGAAVKPATQVADPLPPGDRLRREVLPDPVLLFRYSALTGNGHRIHYDMDYVRQVEGYPGLVVHGPLQATWLAGLLADEPVASFGFRGQRPAFHGNPLVLEGRPGGPGYLLRTLDPSGAVCMQAEATLAQP